MDAAYRTLFLRYSSNIFPEPRDEKMNLLDIMPYFMCSPYDPASRDTNFESWLDDLLIMLKSRFIVINMDNQGGEICSLYPRIIPYLEGDLYNPPSEEYHGMLLEYMRCASRARCIKDPPIGAYRRLPVPVMVFQDKLVCRSSTTEGHIGKVGRASLLLQEVEKGLDTVTAKLGCEVQRADRSLLTHLNVGTVLDIIVEDPCYKCNAAFGDSERLCRELSLTYGWLQMGSFPYPGNEFFREFHDNNFNPQGLFFQWSETVNSPQSLKVPVNPDLNFLGIDWSHYHDWDLVKLTKNYVKYFLHFITASDDGVLIHCTGGGDRSPLFISLIRISLWADGLIHQDLDVAEIVYFNVVYDWMFYGHDLQSGMSNNEDILIFCYTMLEYIDDLTLHEMPTPPVPPLSDLDDNGSFLSNDDDYTPPIDDHYFRAVGNQAEAAHEEWSEDGVASASHPESSSSFSSSDKAPSVSSFCISHRQSAVRRKPSTTRKIGANPPSKPAAKQPTPAKVATSAQPAPAKVATSSQPTPAKVATTSQPAPAKVATASQPAPAKVATSSQPAPAKVATTSQPAPAKAATASQPTPAKVATSSQPAPAKVATSSQPAPTKVATSSQPTPAKAATSSQPAHAKAATSSQPQSKPSAPVPKIGSTTTTTRTGANQRTGPRKTPNKPEAKRTVRSSHLAPSQAALKLPALPKFATSSRQSKTALLMKTGSTTSRMGANFGKGQGKLLNKPEARRPVRSAHAAPSQAAAVKMPAPPKSATTSRQTKAAPIAKAGPATVTKTSTIPSKGQGKTPLNKPEAKRPVKSEDPPASSVAISEKPSSHLTPPQAAGPKMPIVSSENKHSPPDRDLSPPEDWPPPPPPHASNVFCQAYVATISRTCQASVEKTSQTCQASVETKSQTCQVSVDTKSQTCQANAATTSQTCQACAATSCQYSQTDGNANAIDNTLFPPSVATAVRPPNVSTVVRPANVSTAVRPPSDGPSVRPPSEEPSVRPPNIGQSVVRPPSDEPSVRPPNIGQSVLRPPSDGQSVCPPSEGPSVRPISPPSIQSSSFPSLNQDQGDNEPFDSQVDPYVLRKKRLYDARCYFFYVYLESINRLS